MGTLVGGAPVATLTIVLCSNDHGKPLAMAKAHEQTAHCMMLLQTDVISGNCL